MLVAHIDGPAYGLAVWDLPSVGFSRTVLLAFSAIAAPLPVPCEDARSPPAPSPAYLPATRSVCPVPGSSRPALSSRTHSSTLRYFASRDLSSAVINYPVNKYIYSRSLSVIRPSFHL